eukprot:comp17820_c0_seq2/m.17939 comp17820_c0_seq2/g.17939  ORF comp17820_c0_seq2/g.17939 comp17820_c0_seq2/m.17939 type:complete len:720 (-) comp17820_c0_seq2:326-2485(-)
MASPQVLVVEDQVISVEFVNGNPKIPGFYDDTSDVPLFGFDIPEAEVRWYYIKSHTGVKVAFTDVDGINLEVAFRKHHKAQPKGAIAPAKPPPPAPDAPQKSGIPLDNASNVSLTSLDSSTLPEGKKDRSGIVMVLDRLYEVDMETTSMRCIYWEQPAQKVMRQLWFTASKYGMNPVEEWVLCDDQTATALELVRNTYHVLNTNQARLRVNLPHVRRQAVFFSPDDIWIFDYWLMGAPSWLSKPPEDKNKGWRLRRGFRYTETQLKGIEATHNNLLMEGRPEDVTHLLLCIHGMGQKLDACDVYYDTDMLRSSLKSVCLDNYPGLQNKYMVLPVEWRKELDLAFDASKPDNGRVNINDLTLENIKQLRDLLNATVLDVVYYMDPECSQAIYDELARQIIRVYLLFIERHPHFVERGGKQPNRIDSQSSQSSFSQGEGVMRLSPSGTSLSALSSASEMPPQYFVIQPTDTAAVASAKREMLKLKTFIDKHSGDNQEEEDGVQKLRSLALSYKQLPFAVDCLFLMGSPMGIFLGVRNAKISVLPVPDQDTVMPRCRKVFNVFHPSDPIAYRIEPCIMKEYANKKPQFVPYHKGGLRLHNNVNAAVDGATANIQKVGRNLFSQFVSVAKTVDAASKQFKQLGSEQAKPVAENTEAPERTQTAAEQATFAAVNPDGRVDWVLQAALFDNEYLSLITAHTTYWNDPDTSLFLLRQMFDLPVPTK